MKKFFNWLFTNWKNEKPSLIGWVLNAIVILVLILMIISIIGGNIRMTGVALCLR